jgi:hypothetical protein
MRTEFQLASEDIAIVTSQWAGAYTGDSAVQAGRSPARRQAHHESAL